MSSRLEDSPSCANCHPQLSNCGLDVETMDTTFKHRVPTTLVTRKELRRALPACVKRAQVFGRDGIGYPTGWLRPSTLSYKTKIECQWLTWVRRSLS